MLDLIQLFQTFDIPISSFDRQYTFSAVSIEDYEIHKLAKDTQGLPVVLIAVQRSNTKNPSIALENLSITHNIECRVLHPSGNIDEGIFTIIHCKDDDYNKQKYFLRVLSSIIISLGTEVKPQDITNEIMILVDLFRAMNAPPKKSIQGLWAELFLMARSKSPAILINAWHKQPEDRFDFNLDHQSIEVKSTSHSRRQHHFSLEQLTPINNNQILIASLFVERASVGKSLDDLLNQIRASVIDNPDLLLHLDKIVGLTLGSNWHLSMDERFDEKLAKKTLQFYEAKQIPCIAYNVPLEVTGVHFISDLTNCNPIILSEYKKKGELFRVTL